MAELNEAYRILSNARERKDYDEELRKYQAGEPLEAPPPPSPEVAGEAPPVAAPRPRARAGREVVSGVVSEFANKLRHDLLSSRQVLLWKEKRLEGFNWGLEAGFWGSHYYVATRGFATLDLAAGQKFTTYAHLAIERCRHWWKNDFFLFLLPFQRMNDPEQVQAACRRFRPVRRGPKAIIALLDLTHGRGLSCGPFIKDERFEGLLRKLRLARA